MTEENKTEECKHKWKCRNILVQHGIHAVVMCTECDIVQKPLIGGQYQIEAWDEIKKKLEEKQSKIVKPK